MHNWHISKGGEQKSVIGIVILAVVLIGCVSGNSPAKAPVGAGTPIPVTYYPTPTGIAVIAQVVPLPTPDATEAPPAPVPETAQPLALPTDTPAVAPTAVQATTAPTDAPSPQPTDTTAPTSAPAAPAAAGCPSTSSESYALIPIDGAPYKNNAITDNNADFRLLLLGYSPFDAPRSLIDLPGGADPGAPKISGVFDPPRQPEIAATYKRNDWNWDEAGPPPYGSRGGVNNDPEAPVAVVDFRTNTGERVKLPARGADIFTGVTAMVVFASENELAAVYYRQDNVALGYMVHLANFCVDPSLVAAYRTQLNGGKRSTNQLPGVRNGQSVGTSTGILTVAIRDRARFYDPRSRKDWW
jgi:hypothetical protein